MTREIESIDRSHDIRVSDEQMYDQKLKSVRSGIAELARQRAALVEALAELPGV